MSNSPLTLVVLAAGRSTRYGGLKQLDPIGPGQTTLLEYALFDAVRSGFSRFVIVIQGERRADFSDKLGPAIAGGLDVRFVHQPDHDAEWTAASRERPWGTGFAVLACRHTIEGRFGVCNADDFYGRRAFQGLADGLLEGGTPEGNGLLVSYPLGETLSDNGGVSRGLCVRGEGGTLAGIREVLELVAQDGRIHGVDVTGAQVTAAPDTPVSMNLWGFQPGFLRALGSKFADFLNAAPSESDEFYLSEAVGQLVMEGRMACRLVEAGEGWLGVTFSDDRERVALALASLVDSGVYPSPLWRSPTLLTEVDGS